MNFVVKFIIILTLYFPSIADTQADIDDEDDEACCYDENDVRLQLEANETLYKEFISRIKWPSEVIYYNVDPHMDPVIVHYVTQAIDYINFNLTTCVKWEQRFPDGSPDPAEHWVTFFQARDEELELIIDAELGWIKKRNNTFVRIGYNFAKAVLKDHLTKYQTSIPDPSDKLGLEFQSVILHEMLHIMGLLHEHQRGDRDCWVYVSLSAIAQDPRSMVPYHNWARAYSPKFPYDKQSVMHYTDFRPFMYAHDGSPLGRKDGKISDLDIHKLNYIYCEWPPYCETSHKCKMDLHNYRYDPTCFRQGSEYNASLHCTPCEKTEFVDEEI